MLRRSPNLKEATGEGQKSTALDAAADYCLKLRGGTTAVQTGRIEASMERAVDQGSVTPEEVTTIRDTEELSATAGYS